MIMHHAGCLQAAQQLSQPPLTRWNQCWHTTPVAHCYCVYLAGLSEPTWHTSLRMYSYAYMSQLSLHEPVQVHFCVDAVHSCCGNFVHDIYASNELEVSTSVWYPARLQHLWCSELYELATCPDTSCLLPDQNKCLCICCIAHVYSSKLLVLLQPTRWLVCRQGLGLWNPVYCPARHLSRSDLQHLWQLMMQLCPVALLLGLKKDFECK